MVDRLLIVVGGVLIAGDEGARAGGQSERPRRAACGRTRFKALERVGRESVIADSRRGLDDLRKDLAAVRWDVALEQRDRSGKRVFVAALRDGENRERDMPEVDSH